MDVAGEYAYNGDYCYVGTVAAFDMASTLRNIYVENVTIRMEDTESNAVFRDATYVAVAGLEGGGWNSTVENCSVSGTIELDVKTEKSHGGSVYLGGSNTSSTGCEVEADIQVKVVKPAGTATVAVGGFAGSQYYMTASGNTVKAAIATENTLDQEQGKECVGAMVGQLDPFWAMQILQYTPVAACGTSGNTAEATLNGEPFSAVIGEAPMLDGQPLCWINNGDYEIVEGYTAPSNVEAVIEAYGSAVPVEVLMQGII